jgi:2-phospho-L-lactate guanylyltransferase (CobY/MobA/RfbA family)
MSLLLIPIAPLSRTKSRLRDCFSKELLKDLTIAMFNDLAKKVSSLECFDSKIVYCNSDEILSLAREYGLLGIKEELSTPRKSFDQVIQDLNTIAVKKFDAEWTLFTFLDVILISELNFKEITKLINNNDLVICPAINSGGISVLGRKPPNIIPTYFSEPRVPSLIALLNNARINGLKFAIYDSFRAGFDIDLKQDLILAFEYLKIFNLENSQTYQFLKNNLKITLYKKDINDNRRFEIKKLK